LPKFRQARIDPINFVFELFEHRIKIEVLFAINGNDQSLAVSSQVLQCLGIAQLDTVASDRARSSVSIATAPIR
jgi:hypothetical protein